MKPAVQLDHVQIVAAGRILLDVPRLAVGTGERVAIVGPNGAGKSTLLKVIGGLVPAQRGRTVVLGRSVGPDEPERADAQGRTGRRDRRALRRETGLLMQGLHLVPRLSARENVALVTDIADDPMTPEAALDRVGLADRRDHFPSQLSGGEQQRVAIARAIAKNPRLLLCDEPTGALDSATGIRVLEALLEANRRLGTTTVVITHNAAIAGMADRVIRIADGRIAQDERNATRLTPSELRW
jgi:putative ABC transport system ATP-binding protein